MGEKQRLLAYTDSRLDQTILERIMQGTKTTLVVAALLATAVAISACRREAPVATGFGAPVQQTQVAE
ncbi:MAG: hypothetical protein ACR2O4_17930 [Hyphomicrobiaceae bacterium]